MPIDSSETRLPPSGSKRDSPVLGEPADQQAAKRGYTPQRPEIDTKDTPTQSVRDTDLDEGIHRDELGDRPPSDQHQQNERKLKLGTYPSAINGTIKATCPSVTISPLFREALMYAARSAAVNASPCAAHKLLVRR